VRNEAGTEEKFARAQADIKGYVVSLGREDAVVLEASAGALYWAEKIQGQGARCVVMDAYRFRIIRDSWQKTDKRDAANLSLDPVDLVLQLTHLLIQQIVHPEDLIA